MSAPARIQHRPASPKIPIEPALALLRRLHRSRASIEDLIAATRISRASVFRLMSGLHRFGMQINADGGGGYYVADWGVFNREKLGAAIAAPAGPGAGAG